MDSRKVIKVAGKISMTGFTRMRITLLSNGLCNNFTKSKIKSRAHKEYSQLRKRKRKNMVIIIIIIIKGEKGWLLKIEMTLPIFCWKSITYKINYNCQLLNLRLVAVLIAIAIAIVSSAVLAQNQAKNWLCTLTTKPTNMSKRPSKTQKRFREHIQSKIQNPPKSHAKKSKWKKHSQSYQNLRPHKMMINQFLRLNLNTNKWIQESQKLWLWK